MSPWDQIDASLAEPVPTTLAERLRPWAWPAVFVGALAVAANIGWPLFSAIMFIGPCWADWRRP